MIPPFRLPFLACPAVPALIIEPDGAELAGTVEAEVDARLLLLLRGRATPLPCAPGTSSCICFICSCLPCCLAGALDADAACGFSSHPAG